MSNQTQYCFKRYEKKYFITEQQYKILCSSLAEYTQPDKYGKYSINNIYYDTDDWRLIRASIEKPIYKEKLRIRSYGTADDGSKIFAEIKKKYDGIVYKRRIETDINSVEPFLNCLLDENTYGQIGREIYMFQKTYKAKPKIFISYDRTALAGTADTGLRITFDTNMRWRDTDLDLTYGAFGKPITDDGKILMEVKFDGACPLYLSKILSQNEIFPVSFSKYGTCYTKYILKNNFYKEALYSA